MYGDSTASESAPNISIKSFYNANIVGAYLFHFRSSWHATLGVDEWDGGSYSCVDALRFVDAVVVEKSSIFWTE